MTNQANQSVKGNQTNTNIKGGVIVKKIENVQLVKKAVNGVEVPVQVAFEVMGVVAQYGFSKDGGSKKFLYMNSKLEESNDAALVRRLKAANISNYKWVEQEIKKLRPITVKRSVAGVEAGRVDVKGQEAVTVTHEVRCSRCKNPINSKSVVTFSEKNYGAPICMPCQHKGRKAGNLEFVGKQQAPKTWEKKEPVKREAPVISPKAVLGVEDNRHHVPANLVSCIQNFPIDIETQSVETVQLLRALKKVFGDEAQGVSDSEYLQEEYIRTGVVKSEEESLVSAWYQLHVQHKLNQPTEVVEDYFNLEETSRIASEASANSPYKTLEEELASNDGMTMCLTCHEDKMVSEMANDFDCVACAGVLNKSVVTPTDVTTGDDAASEASGETTEELTKMEQGEASSEDGAISEIDTKDQSSVVAGHSNNQGAGSTGTDDKASIQDDFASLMNSVPVFDEE